MKEMSDLICGKAAVGGNYNSTRDTWFIKEMSYTPTLSFEMFLGCYRIGVTQDLFQMTRSGVV